jgi:hypothetical protein
MTTNAKAMEHTISKMNVNITTLSRLKAGDKFHLWSNPSLTFVKIRARPKLFLIRWPFPAIAKYYYVSLTTYELYASEYDFRVILAEDEDIKRIEYVR